jgi:hypothetical protein
MAANAGVGTEGGQSSRGFLEGMKKAGNSGMIQILGEYFRFLPFLISSFLPF